MNSPMPQFWLLLILAAMIMGLALSAYLRIRRTERWGAERRIIERRQDARRETEDRRNARRQEHDLTHNHDRREEERRNAERREGEVWQEEYKALKLQIERKQQDQPEA